MTRSFCLRVFAFPFGAEPDTGLSRANHPTKLCICFSRIPYLLFFGKYFLCVFTDISFFLPHFSTLPHKYTL